MALESPVSSREARIDLGAARRNIRALVSDDADVAVDVTGDGYGHGALRIGRVALEEGARVAVRDVRERERLTAAGLDSDVGIADDRARELASRVYGLGWGDAVMRCTAQVLAYKTVAAGEGVSYGYTWRAPVDTTLAFVPLGYADGIHRGASNVGRVWLEGRVRLIAGRVAMDAHMLDLGEPLESRPPAGTLRAVVFGEAGHGHASAHEWAESIGASPLEVTSRIGTRVQRVWS
ncbi:alanine racemase C-terminal domain-containing protein [Marisediminicola sp. LYQ85]|uniref:alanine racemase C-terminal domain-containing protein n=1 Tax=Marisediminicola sp. LYQ85 TaxID=3391062 RepID=UPI00398320B3